MRTMPILLACNKKHKGEKMARKGGEPILPKISRDPIMSKSVWAGIFTTILAFLVSGVINLTSLTANQIMSAGFLMTLIFIFVIAEIVDVLEGNKLSRYIMQNLVGAILVALLLGTVLSFVGVTTLTLNIVSGLGVLIGTVALFYIGVWFIKKYVQ